MSKSKRALRRHHRERMIQKALKHLIIRGYDEYFTDEEIYETALRTYNHLKGCSCLMCCNPRKNGWGTVKTRLTMQELKVYNSLPEQTEEYYDARSDATDEPE